MKREKSVAEVVAGLKTRAERMDYWKRLFAPSLEKMSIEEREMVLRKFMEMDKVKYPDDEKP